MDLASLLSVWDESKMNRVGFERTNRLTSPKSLIKISEFLYAIGWDQILESLQIIFIHGREVLANFGRRWVFLGGATEARSGGFIRLEATLVRGFLRPG